MSIFSFNQDAPVAVPAEQEEVVEITEDDYTTAEEPEFGDDV